MSGPGSYCQWAQNLAPGRMGSDIKAEAGMKIVCNWVAEKTDALDCTRLEKADKGLISPFWRLVSWQSLRKSSQG